MLIRHFHARATRTHGTMLSSTYVYSLAAGSTLALYRYTAGLVRASSASSSAGDMLLFASSYATLCYFTLVW